MPKGETSRPYNRDEKNATKASAISRVLGKAAKTTARRKLKAQLRKAHNQQGKLLGSQSRKKGVPK